jgi:hypothetical protein
MDVVTVISRVPLRLRGCDCRRLFEVTVVDVRHIPTAGTPAGESYAVETTGRM